MGMTLPLDLKMEFVFHDRHLRTDPGADLAIDEHGLGDAMIRNPSLFAFYASIRAFARKRQRDLVIAEKVLHGRLLLACRNQLAATKDGEKEIRRATDKQLEAEVAVLPEMLKAQQASSQAEYEADMADAIREAFRDQREMLVNLSADRRAEMSAGVGDGRAMVERAMAAGREGRR